MTKEPHYSFFTTPVLLVAALLQACIGGNTIPKVLSVKTPAEVPLSKASNKVSAHVLRSEEKQRTYIQRNTQIADLGRTTHIPKGSFRQHPNYIAQGLQNRPTTPNTPMGTIGEHTPASSPVIRRAPLPGLLADDKEFKRSEQTSIKLCNSPHPQDLPGYSDAEPSIEALLKRLQNLGVHSIEAYIDCIAAITRIVDGDNAPRVCMVLNEVHAKLSGFLQDAKVPYGLEYMLKKLSNMRTDIEHFQRIAQDRKPKTTWHYLPSCLCCQDRVQVDCKRVSGIVRNYPKIATTLVPMLLEKYKASLFYDEQLIININDAKALFIYDCLTTYPEHAPRLFSIIQEAMPTLTTETEVIERLPAFIAQAPKYALEGIRILNAALHNPRSRIRILALRASISLLHTFPDHGPCLNQDQLHKAFGRMRRALQGPESATKRIAQEVLVCIQKDSEGFLSKLWNRYTEQRQQKNF